MYNNVFLMIVLSRLNVSYLMFIEHRRF